MTTTQIVDFQIVDSFPCCLCKKVKYFKSFDNLVRHNGRFHNGEEPKKREKKVIKVETLGEKLMRMSPSIGKMFFECINALAFINQQIRDKQYKLRVATINETKQQKLFRINPSVKQIFNEQHESMLLVLEQVKDIENIELKSVKVEKEDDKSYLCYDSDSDDEKEWWEQYKLKQEKIAKEREELRKEREEQEKQIITPKSCLVDYDSEEERDDIRHELKCNKIMKENERHRLKIKLEKEKEKGDETGNPTNFKIYMFIDYNNRNNFKNRCGGKWDPINKLWYVEYNLFDYNINFNDITQDDVKNILNKNINLKKFERVVMKNNIVWNGLNKDNKKIDNLNIIIDDFFS